MTKETERGDNDGQYFDFYMFPFVTGEGKPVASIVKLIHFIFFSYLKNHWRSRASKSMDQNTPGSQVEVEAV